MFGHHCCRPILALIVVPVVARQHFYVHGLFRHLKDERSLTRLTPPPPRCRRPVSLTPTAFHRTPAAATTTFDVQFPFANEASALTCEHQILSMSLSHGVPRGPMRCIANTTNASPERPQHSSPSPDNDCRTVFC